MKTIIKVVLAVLTGSRACSRSAKRTSLFFSFLIAAFMLSLVPTTYVCAQGSIETPAERKALKQAALDNDISVSALIRLWLEKYQTEKEAGKRG